MKTLINPWKGLKRPDETRRLFNGEVKTLINPWKGLKPLSKGSGWPLRSKRENPNKSLEGIKTLMTLTRLNDGKVKTLINPWKGLKLKGALILAHWVCV